MSSRAFLAFIIAFSLLSWAALAQSVAAPSSPVVDNDFVHQQFGDSCSLVPQFPPMTGDMNGDGVEDIVIVARCKNALIEQDEKNYKVIDPMDAFYGYGNPSITTGFAPDDPKLRGIALLVIHGSGADAWRSPTPLAKFVIINVTVKTVTIKKMKVTKRKTTTAIYIEEAGADEMTSAVFWDGRKYRYNPLGSSME
jgi:hypothetical protein